MSGKLPIEMSEKELLTTFHALKDSDDPVSEVLDLLDQVKDRVYVEVDMEKGFLIFGFYRGFLMSLMETLQQDNWYREGR